MIPADVRTGTRSSRRTMPTHYAAQFQVEPPDGDAAALEAAVGALAEKWVSGFYPEPLALPVGGAVAPQPGHSVLIEAASAGPHRHWSLRWRRPGRTQPVGWESVLTLAFAGELAELSCVVRLLAAGRPSSSARRPGVVRAVVERLSCSAGGLPLRATAVPLAAGLVPDFVQGGLCSPARTLPVLVISRDEEREEPAVEPGLLADRLAGLAHLVLLDGSWAARALTAAVGDDLSCSGGALRLYRPGFSLDADPLVHPRFEAPASGTPGQEVTLPDLLLQLLASDAGARFQPGAITRAAREALGVRSEAPPPRARRAGSPGFPAGEAAPPDHALLDRIVAEHDELARRNGELEEQTLDLEVALEEARASLAATTLRLEATKVALASRPRGPQVNADAEPELTCVHDAVALAKVRFADRLRFLASADASAAASPFQNARRAFEALAAVDEVAHLRRASIRDRTSVGSMENLFQNRGFLYKAHESMTARGRWGEEYEVVFEGRKESIEEHVAIGTGGPESCLRIHFFWDAGAMRFVVAHVGRHKTNTRS